MTSSRGGRQPPDYRMRVGGPGRMSQRTDMSGQQPQRVPTGLPYGDRRELEGAQQAIPLPRRGGSPSRPPASGASAPPGLDPMLGAPTARPDEPLTAGAQTVPPSVVTARIAAMLLEDEIRDMPFVSASTFQLLEDLQTQATFLEDPYEPVHIEQERIPDESYGPAGPAPAPPAAAQVPPEAAPEV